MSHLNAQIVRLYDTVFDRAPDAGGLEFWNGATHQGLGLRDLANFFIAAPEFASTYGEPTNLGFVQSLYQNILDREGEAEGIAFWTNALDSGLADRAQVVVGFSESAEHIQQMAQPIVVVVAPPVPPASSPGFPARPVRPGRTATATTSRFTHGTPPQGGERGRIGVTGVTGCLPPPRARFFSRETCITRAMPCDAEV